MGTHAATGHPELEDGKSDLSRPTETGPFALICRIFRFYRDGFRAMRPTGRTLWCIILIKLFIVFFVLRLFFFPRFLAQFGDEQEQGDYVSQELVQRAIQQP